MGRTGERQNKETSADTRAQSNQSFNTGQQSIADYQRAISGLREGKDVGANPFKSADYLSNVNKLQSESLNTANDTGKAEINRWNSETGGLNSGVVPLAIRDQSLQKGRLADLLTAERSASDFRSNLGWQQYLAEGLLAPAGVESGFYGTGTSGRVGAGKNLADLGAASYGPWNQVINAAGNVGSAYANSKGGN